MKNAHMEDHVEEVLLAGGGLRVVPFLGVIMNLHLPSLRVFTGISAGGLLGFLLALGHDVPATLRRLVSVDMGSHLDVRRLLEGGTLLEAAAMREVLHGMLRERGLDAGCTFAALARATGKRLRLVVANATSVRLEVLDETTAPDVEVAAALCACMGVPLLMPPTKLAGNLYIDAGLVNNAPLHLALLPDRCVAMVHFPRLSRSELSAGACVGAPVRSLIDVAYGLKTSALPAAALQCCRVRELVLFPKHRLDDEDIGTLRISTRGIVSALLEGCLAWRLRGHPEIRLLMLAAAVAIATLCLRLAHPQRAGRRPSSSTIPRRGGHRRPWTPT